MQKINPNWLTDQLEKPSITGNNQNMQVNLETIGVNDFCSNK